MEDATYGSVLAVRWQKTEGSDFLPLLEGSMLFLPVDDGVIEVQTVTDYYADLLAHVHGEALHSY